MNGPIERAARAMHASIQPEPEWSWDDPLYEPVRAIYRAGVRSALLALQDPSPNMQAIAAGADFDRGLPPGSHLSVYQAMIAEAVADTN